MGWGLSLTHPADGVDRLGDMPPVNLCQFPAGSTVQGAWCPAPSGPLPPAAASPPAAPSPRALTPPSYVSPLSWPLRYCCGASCPESSAVPSSPWKSQWGRRKGQWQVWGLSSLRSTSESPAPPAPWPRLFALPLVHLLQPLELSCVKIQDNLPEPLLSLRTQVANR